MFAESAEIYNDNNAAIHIKVYCAILLIKPVDVSNCPTILNF